MAMVYQSKKNNNLNFQESIPGPGYYNLAGQTGATSVNKIRPPFGSDSLRKEIHDCKGSKNSPGPGSYFSENAKTEVASSLKESQLQPLYKLIDFNANDSNSILSQELKSPLGFNSKELRFKNGTQQKNIGPGSYQPEIMKLPTISVKAEKKSRSPISNRKILEMKSDINITASIPSKSNCYGFETNNIGLIKPSIDPLKNKKHDGTFINSAGPGEYEINTERHWLKKGTNWSKSHSVKLKPLNKSVETASSELDIFSTNANSGIELNTTTKPLIKFSHKDKEIILKSFKQRMILSKENKAVEEVSLFEKLLNSKETPGPGYYYNAKSVSGFKPNSIAEEFQSFGSSSVRFKNERNNPVLSNYQSEYLGPGSYFKDEYLFEKNKMKEVLNKLKNKPSTSLEKIKEKKLGMSRKSESSPGPGSYNIENSQSSPKRINYNGIFGSSEKRFPKNEKEVREIGPGSYFENDRSSWNKLNSESINNLISNPKKFFRPKRERKVIEKDNSEETAYPCVGIYNPDKLYNIDYKIAKSTNKMALINAPFNSMRRRFDEAGPKPESILGPGYYYKEKKGELKQSATPFLSNEPKCIAPAVSNQNNLGPGHYDSASYFDWNKKSFNIQFL